METNTGFGFEKLDLVKAWG